MCARKYHLELLVHGCFEVGENIIRVTEVLFCSSKHASYLYKSYDKSHMPHSKNQAKKEPRRPQLELDGEGWKLLAVMSKMCRCQIQGMFLGVGFVNFLKLRLGDGYSVVSCMLICD